jgi:alpha-galactosidase
VRGGVAALGVASTAGVRQAEAYSSAKASSFIELLRLPDRVTAYQQFDKTLPSGEISLARQGEEWVGGEVRVECDVQRDSLTLTLSSLTTPVSLVHVRWRVKVDQRFKVLGDAWERSYGELGWRNLIPERVLPWYFATYDDSSCHSYGVKTDAAALSFWQVDADGVSLWLNVTNGGQGVLLGQRRLKVATVVSRRGTSGEDAVEAVTALCKAMCARTSRALQPFYGANDWNYSYGRSTAESILSDTEFIAELSPRGGVRPFSVIDGGWVAGSAGFPDMAMLASKIKQQTVRPGIWIRPLEAPQGTAPGLLITDARFGRRKERASALAYDPTVPEAQEKIRAKVTEVAGWGYEMVKHDFTTYDLFGQWGFEMGPQPTIPEWGLHDRSRTNAEVVSDLYKLIRDAAGERMLIDGCNTIGHLGQGIFDLQRTADDTSGRQWERTRRMGVNTVAFRLPQHGTFFCVDPDMVGITDAIPWEFNRQWLDVLARSGVATIVAPGPPSRGAEQRSAIRDAFQIAAAGGLGARPVDWMETSAPTQWLARATSGGERERKYDWNGVDGASAFLLP